MLKLPLYYGSFVDLNLSKRKLKKIKILSVIVGYCSSMHVLCVYFLLACNLETKGNVLIGFGFCFGFWWTEQNDVVSLVPHCDECSPGVAHQGSHFFMNFMEHVLFYFILNS